MDILPSRPDLRVGFYFNDAIATKSVGRCEMEASIELTDFSSDIATGSHWLLWLVHNRRKNCAFSFTSHGVGSEMCSFHVNHVHAEQTT